MANYDFTSPTVFANVKLDRLPAKPTVENSPVSVVYTHDKIIDGHNGVFDPRFMDFLPPYIAFIEGKRLVQRYQRFRQLRHTSHEQAPPPPHFDNARLEECIFRFQKGDANALGEVVKLSEQRILALIRFHKTNHYQSESELLSDVNFKLIRAVRRLLPLPACSSFLSASRHRSIHS